MDSYEYAQQVMDDDGAGSAITSIPAGQRRQRPALLGPRYVPETAKQFAQFDAGAAAADAAWDDPQAPWLTNADMCGRDRYFVHGYWARYFERLPELNKYARQAA